MNKLMLLLFAVPVIAFSQEQKKITTYKNGYNGMEYIVNSNSETTIVSTFNSKHKIKDEIAENVYNEIKKCQLNNGDTLIIKIDKAIVTGKCYFQKKGKLTAINFYYEKVEWASGDTELYVNNG
jgi:DNA integrity scanning protein DisA with diadenylate cyclase activity